MRLTIRPRAIALILSAIALIITTIGYFEHYSELHLDFTVPGFGFFNLDHDLTVPVWYSTALLLACAWLLDIIALSVKAKSGPYVKHWFALAIIFAYISLDEMLSLHERLTEVLQNALNPSGLLNFAWVIVGIPLLLLFVIAYARFLSHLPPATRLNFIIAGVIFIAGGLGVEMLGGAYLEQNGADMGYFTLVAIEEFLEMIGAVYFIYALLMHMRNHQTVEIRLH